jgi:hypothetical protein
LIQQGCIPASGDVNEKKTASGEQPTASGDVRVEQPAFGDVRVEQPTCGDVREEQPEGKPTSNASMRSRRTSGDVHE